MVIAAQRAYSDAIRWIKAARPRRLEGWRFAWRAYAGCFAGGSALLGVIALIAPSEFGQVGTSTADAGLPALVIACLAGAVALLAFARRKHLWWLMTRIREPLVTPLTDERGYEEASDALASCPSAFQTRFAVTRVWGPAALVVLGATCAFSTAYFLLDAILSGGRVGWGQPAYAGAFLALGVIVFRLAAPSLATWRLAASVHKTTSTGYPS